LRSCEADEYAATLATSVELDACSPAAWALSSREIAT
jgi:hypothetical protein